MPFATASAVVLVLLAMLATAQAQTGTPQTKTLLNTETTTNFPDNSSGLITPLITRQSLVDYIASWQQAPRVRAVAGVSDTIVVDDYGKLVTYTNAAPVAVTLPQATTTFATFNFFTCNKGAGLVTITPTTSNINGNATLTLQNNQCSLIVSDATNWQATPAAITGCGTGLTQASGACGFSAARLTLPTTQVFTSGTNATYTTPANVLWIEILLVGGGGGGSGGGSAPGNGSAGNPTCWNTSGTACSSPVYQAGGGGLGSFSTGTGGVGGTVSGSGTCTTAVAGGGGGGELQGAANGTAGGVGGNSSLGGGGASAFGANPGTAGAANSGGGGAGGGTGATQIFSGVGGGAGATCYVIINTPAASYTYTVGATASAGGAGTGGGAGGAGAAGYIRVIEHYGS